MSDDAEYGRIADERARGRFSALGRATVVRDAQRLTAAERSLDGRQGLRADLRDRPAQRGREADFRRISGY